MSNKKFTKEHEWINVSETPSSVGITFHAQDQLGDVVFLEMPKKGMVKANQKVGVIESVKAVSDLYCPVDGEIVELNSDVEQNPSLLNEAPEKTWIFKIKASSFEGLLSKEEYDKLI